MKNNTDRFRTALHLTYTCDLMEETYYFQIDEADYDLLYAYSWNCAAGEVKTKVEGKNVYLKNLLQERDPSYRYGNGLDILDFRRSVGKTNVETAKATKAAHIAKVEAEMAEAALRRGTFDRGVITTDHSETSYFGFKLIMVPFEVNEDNIPQYIPGQQLVGICANEADARVISDALWAAKKDFKFGKGGDSREMMEDYYLTAACATGIDFELNVTRWS